MYKIEYENCGNVKNATTMIEADKINIKFGVNGAGKSTLGKSLFASVVDDQQLLKRYVPLGTNYKPSIKYNDIKSILYFDNEYVDNFLFKEDLINESFEIITKTPDYEKKLRDINNELNNLKLVVKSEEINSILLEINKITESIKFNKQNNLDGKSAFAKGLKNIKIENLVDDTHENYIDLIKSPDNYAWIDWFKSGKTFIHDENCPFCLAKLDKKFDKTHDSIVNSFNKTIFKNSKESNLILGTLRKYTSETNAEKILSEQKKGVLSDDTIKLIKSDIDFLNIEKSKLIAINNLDPLRLLDYTKDKLNNLLNSLKINNEYFKEISDELYIKMTTVNNNLNSLIDKINDLNIRISLLNSELAKNIRKISKFVNDFLEIANIPYTIEVIINGSDDSKTILKHKTNEEITHPKLTLSFGELNSLSLMLFCVQAISENPDLIILDDPISSFDGNKKYAIIHQLFSSSVANNLKGKTVVIFTHDFDPVIDFVYNGHPTRDNVKAWFISNHDGIINEEPILKADIISCIKNELSISENAEKNILKRIVSLRNYFDMTLLNNSAEYSILSSLIHLKEKPTNIDGSEISLDILNDAINTIKKYITDFDYNTYYLTLSNETQLKGIYDAGDSVDKIYVSRILLDIKPEYRNNKVLWKFLNESFHSENRYFYNLNSDKFKIIPDYIIDACNDLITKIYI